VEGMLRMMDTEAGFTGPINIGNPGEFTMIELAEKVLSQVGSKSKLVFKPLPQDDPKQRKPDISLAKSKLDWSPTVQLDDGLARTIEYFRRTLEL
jgi:UDP-glucuronate decarboxylase